MEILALALAAIAIMLSAGGLFLNYKNSLIIKKFFGDNASKESLLQELNKYYSETKNSLEKHDDTLKKINDLTEKNMENFATFSARRFNPYEEAGGDLSFCLVLLNRKHNGIMITSLHGRERTRIYTRNITNGEANVELLFDEEAALKDALKNLA